MKDYYAILGVLPHADTVVIDAVYNALVSQYRMNNCAGDDCQKKRFLEELNEAYQVLSDPLRRAAYDQFYSPSCDYLPAKPTEFDYQLLEDAHFVQDAQQDIRKFNHELEKEATVFPVFGLLISSLVILFLSYFVYDLFWSYQENQGVAMPVYENRGDGTVVDPRAGLQWMRCSVGQTWNGDTCQGEVKSMSWTEANALTVEFADHLDWRLPTREELMTLVYCSKGVQKNDSSHHSSGCNPMSQMPAIDTHTFANMDTYRCAYWTASSDPSWQNSAWMVCFNYGSDSLVNAQGSYSVRMVRKAESLSQ